ncbi:GNAT family N-acetyltransferase [Pedobacter sp. Hv1]|uniref:GNAT family N-acetyltransferase n=1 Tax=Pedobacter sp. Hv1 TaxID=1740090 RepID=UPI0006D8AC39|nr:GNAT family N-acetyltransferase [Pedobacter sp. Hv1]KQC00589.1 GCN5 family acetyltransferase [Pedobacter sp. Hv1]
MKKVTLFRPLKTDYLELINVWERSVRATHHFLDEKDIVLYKALIYNDYLYQVDLYGVKQNKHILGFIGLDGDTIQMLFIDPIARGKGVGKYLIDFAIKQKGIRKVDVNEQNEQAVGFYLHLGFNITERFEEDASGRPYPILAMELK